MDPLALEILEAAGAVRGHFAYESGHHGDLWLPLESLLVDARRVHRWGAALAERVAGWEPDVVCGPLAGGSVVAYAVAVALDADVVWAERAGTPGGVRYRLPDPVRRRVAGRRVVVVDDAINAGSAVRGTMADLASLDAELAGIGCLIATGDGAARVAAEHGVEAAALAVIERSLWPPATCPRCATGEPLADPGGYTAP